jgi:aspartate/methionine/tyrosine aminotransferase
MSQPVARGAASTDLGAFRPIPYMGVIWVVAEAVKLGFRNGHPDWCNLGQGQPEVGEMEGAPPRPSSIELEPFDHAYGPVEGTLELRQAIAAHYNRLYRAGRRSLYGPENVSVASGGRLALSRVFAALGEVNLGYQVPDYTAYEDMIGYHQHRFTPVPVPAPEEHGFSIPAAILEREVAQRGLEAFVLSNPCNPTGCVVRGAELEAYARMSRQRGCTLILDEFYSHFVYEGERPAAGPVSAAAFVEDVERDPILLVDGLTKSFRYPGWRVGWAVGPSQMIESITRAASAIDGGPSTPMQRAAVRVLEPARADQETHALRNVFSRKRNLMVERLASMGLHIARPSEGTFYVWACVQTLREPFDDSGVFFRRALERRVMTVPGAFFDVNPGQRRRGRSPFHNWMRFSFGPSEPNVRLGLERLEAMLGGRT